MPKLAPENACGTCLSRKVKCDGQRPVCRRCATARRHCDRSTKALKFIPHKKPRLQCAQSNDRLPAVQHLVSPVAFDLSISSNQTLSCHKSQLSHGLDYAATLAAASPEAALADPCISGLFDHYVNTLAPWYDLNDSRQTFGIVVPQKALHCPILFRAIIAFSAIHKSRTETSSLDGSADIASAFHAACVQDFLILIQEGRPRPHGNELAATCLLRSYEIIDGDMGLQSQQHLLGAYSFAVSEPIDFATAGVLQAGAWNYLREEITVALQYRRPVRTGRIFESHRTGTVRDDTLANDVSYLLARVINFCFPLPSERISHEERIAAWQSLSSHLEAWIRALPHSFKPFSTALRAETTFPSLWMLRPWHIAAQQYSAIAEILLRLFNPSAANGHVTQADLDFAEDRALRVCGLASTNDNVAAHVNAFGPLAFCGRYLTREDDRKALGMLLLESRKLTAWPVHLIMADLTDHWHPPE